MAIPDLVPDAAKQTMFSAPASSDPAAPNLLTVEQGAKPMPSTQQPQVTGNFHVKYPEGMVPLLAPGAANGKGEEPVATIHKTKEDYLEHLASTSKPGQFRFVIRRFGPVQWDGYRLNLGTVEEMEPMSLGAVMDAVRQVHGGGDYQLQVINAEGVPVESFKFRIDTVQAPPRRGPGSTRIYDPVANPPGAAVPGYQPGAIPMGGGGMGQMPSAVSQDLMNARMEEQRYLQEELVLKAKAKAEKAARDYEREKNRDQEVRNAPDDAVKEAISDLRNTVTQLATRNPQEGFIPLLMKSMEQSQLQMAAANERAMKESSELMKVILTVLSAQNNGNKGESQTLKVIAEANDKVVQMAVSSAKSGAEYLQKAFEMMLPKALNQGEHSVKQYFDIYEKGRNAGLEVLRLNNEMMANQEPEFDPDSGFWGGLGQLALRGLSRIVSGAGSGIGANIGNVLANVGQGQAPALPMPAAHAQPQMLVPQFAQPAIQAPTQTAQMLTPVPVQIQQPVPVQQQVQVQTVSENVVRMDSIYDGVLTDGTASQPAMQPLPSQSGVQAAVAQQLDPDLPGHVTEAMRMALTDITAGRTSHDWADYASGKWGHFLASLVGAPDDAGRLRLIQEQCAPEVYNQLYAQLTANPAGLRSFFGSLHQLLQEYQESRHAVA